MADNKKYYYMKLKDNFFDSDEMIVLESMPDGYLYSNILLKLYLRSLKDNGCLMFKGVIPYTPDVLARVVRHSHGVVEKAIQIFKQLGLVEILDNGAIYMLDIQNFIGESSTEADRKREYRSRIEGEKVSGQMSRRLSPGSPDKSTPEIEIDKDLEKDTTTTTPDEPQMTVMDAHQKAFGTLSMNSLVSEYTMQLRKKGYTDSFLIELLLEIAESSAKPSFRYLQEVGDRWQRDKIYSRAQAKADRSKVTPINTKYNQPKREEPRYGVPEIPPEELERMPRG